MNFDEIRRRVAEDWVWDLSDEELRRLTNDAYQRAIDDYLRDQRRAEAEARRERVLYLLRNGLVIRPARRS